MTAQTAVYADGVTKSYGRTHAVAGFGLTAEHGVTGLLGPNGAGKTTLLRCLATVLAPDGGTLRLLGRDPGVPAQRREVRRRLGYLAQEPGFQRGFTVFEFIDYIAILKEMVHRRSRHDEVRRVMAEVSLETVSGKKIRKLSGGMRRRLGLAQALLGSPELLVLDEPTVGLDPEQRLRFRELVGRAGEGRTVILSTHQTEDAAALCNRVVVETPVPPSPGAPVPGAVATSATRRPAPTSLNRPLRTPTCCSSATEDSRSRRRRDRRRHRPPSPLSVRRR